MALNCHIKSIYFLIFGFFRTYPQTCCSPGPGFFMGGHPFGALVLGDSFFGGILLVLFRISKFFLFIMPLGRNPRKGELRKVKKKVKKIKRQESAAKRKVANKGKRMPSRRKAVQESLRQVQAATMPVGRTVG